MNPLIGSSLIGAGSSLLNGVANAVFGDINTKRQIRANKELARYQNDLNIQNWNMQNEYNLPKNQMQRFADAGLNPNLIYGQSNTAGDVGNVNVGSVDASLPLQDSVMNAVNLAMGLRQLHADIRLKGEQADNVQAQTEWTTEKIISEQLNHDLQKWDARLKEATEKGILSDNQLKKFESQVFWDKWRLQREGMQYNNLLLKMNREKILNDMVFGWTKFKSDNQNWQKDYNLRSRQVDFYQDTEFPIKYADLIWRKRAYYDRNIDYHQGSQFAPLFNKLERGVQDMIDGLNSLVSKVPKFW